MMYLQKKKIHKHLYRYIFSAIIFLLITISIIYYNINFSRSGIYKNVLNQKGYTVVELKKPVYFKSFIESSWIPKEENEIIKPNKEIAKIGNISIIIESIMRRDNDIYFNFDAIPYIKYKEGEFLYNNTINKDGTFTSYSNFTGFHIENTKNEIIDVGQRGFGPDSMFSFGINLDKYEDIKDGFTFEYNSSIIYSYTRIK